nr:hypothetical protein [Tanacetum cinerariifolium]
MSFHLMDPTEFEVPGEASQSPKQAPPSPNYVPGYEYPEYVAPSDDEVPSEDQPLPADASTKALSLGYVADTNSEEDLEEDLEEEPKEGPADGRDDDEEEEFFEDDDDKEEEAFEEDDEEEDEHLDPTNSTA